MAPRRLGFSLIEVAVALFLLALLAGTLFVPLRAQVEMRKTEDTRRLLQRAREALVGYAATRGRLPCPADAWSAGQEAHGTDPGSGACPAYHGFLPAAALGLQPTDAQGYALDAWGPAANRIRYAVSDAAVGGATNAHTFTRVNGMRAAGLAALSDPALGLLLVCEAAPAAGAACDKAQTVVSTAPAMVWSAGANAAHGGASRDEAQNPNPQGGSADRVFVARVHSSAPGSEFDDLLAWIPMPILLGRMVAAGQLP